MKNAPAEGKVKAGNWLLAFSVGATLAVIVWWPLVNGAGLLGGDTYSYFMPQKQFYAEQLSSGSLPLWNDRTGFGYPLLAESQTGVLYPSNLLLYSTLDVNTAYSWNVIIHYVLAFAFCWRLAVANGVSPLSALFVAVIYVYGWFPARVSLEWAIIGGAWFPAAVWLSRDLIARPTSRKMIALAIVLALQLLAGHFTLAFITLVLVGAMVLIAAGRRVLSTSTALQNASSDPSGSRIPGWVVAAIAVVSAFLLAGPQLLPTYELKQRSQRDGAEVYHDPGYGHMPPLYLTQLFTGWNYWHSPEVVQSQSFKQLPGSITSGTNQVEAHFYVGLLPLLLVVYGLLAPHIRRRLPGAILRFWLVAGLLATVYATGWLIPVSQHLPGFGYFIGPGRWTIVATMTLALLAGSVVDAMLHRRGLAVRLVLPGVLTALTVPDLLASAKYVADAFPVNSPPVEFVQQSWVRSRLLEEPGVPRLFAPGQNLGNMLQVSTYPVYLGLAPTEYYDKDLMFPPDADAGGAARLSGEPYSEEQYQWLIRSGITHVLSETPLESDSQRLELIGQGIDALYARAWGSPNPMFLYRLAEAEGRIRSDPREALSSFEFTLRTPQRVAIVVHVNRDCTIVLKDLNYPGWQVTVDDHSAIEERADGMFRAVAVASGTHTVAWTYRPMSLVYGIAMSLAGLVFLSLTVLFMNRPARVIRD